MQATDFILEIDDLYNPALRQAQHKSYLEFLFKFADAQLDELWEATKVSHCLARPPTIGELNKYSKEVTPLQVVNTEQAEWEQRARLKPDEIFATEIGQLSLKQGFSASYYIHCKEKGIPEDQGDNTLMEFQRGKYAAESAYDECKQMAKEGEALNIAPALLRLRRSQLERNRAWESKYSPVQH